MGKPKRVAIIGAGPSGLVMAKTLLHHYPKGRFEPTIFDSKSTVGGLWAVTRPHINNSTISANDKNKDKDTTPSFIDCFMRTNLSRFTVSFSDHAWSGNRNGDGNVEGGEYDEEKEEDTLFPQAWQVNDYLKTYTARFLPRDIFRLSCQVVSTQRTDNAGAQGRWKVEWKDLSEIEEKQPSLSSEAFDYLVVASGYFSRPYIPEIPGLDKFPRERVMHSSSLRAGSGQLMQACANVNDNDDEHDNKYKIVVIGGSMSGAEAAASIALDLPSSTKTNAPTSSAQLQVHHVSPRPFWAVPTYLPANDQPGSFLPLDIVMYDLARRPPGDIQFSLSPVTSDRARLVHGYFESLIGSNQADLAMNLALGADADRNRPPWVAVTDHYAELVRAGDITPTLGRVSAARWATDAPSQTPGDGKEKGVLEVTSQEDTKITTLMDNVAAIVLATGFTPFDSLSFLPSDVLDALEYSDSDVVFPIVLDEKATWNPNVPELGFVGLYRGPYWGVMEMQARALARRWSQDDNEHTHSKETAAILEKMRDLRKFLSSSSSSSSSSSPSVSQLRAQFPMGDYVGLMEMFARELGIPRLPLRTVDTRTSKGSNDRTGPVIPARYAAPAPGEKGNISIEETTIASLQNLLKPSSKDRQRSLCRAVLRALHGKWQYERRSVFGPSSGWASIHIRKTLGSAGFRTDYTYSENNTPQSAIFRHLGDGHISTIRSGGHGPNLPLPSRGKIQFVSVERLGNSQYRHSAREIEHTTSASDADVGKDSVESYTREYIFVMNGVLVTSWEERLQDRQAMTVGVTTYTR